MFDVGLGELVALGVVALLVLGPDRLPQAAAQAGRLVRELRAMAAGARRELGEHIDPELAELDLRSIDPRRAIRDAVLDPGTDGERPRRPRPARPRGRDGDGPRRAFDPDAT